MPEIKIEKGKVIPEKRQFGRWKLIAQKMKAGDSVLLDTRANAIGLCSALRNLGLASTQRKDANGKIRVWRIKGNV